MKSVLLLSLFAAVGAIELTKDSFGLDELRVLLCSRTRLEGSARFGVQGCCLKCPNIFCYGPGMDPVAVVQLASTACELHEGHGKSRGLVLTGRGLVGEWDGMFFFLGWRSGAHVCAQVCVSLCVCVYLCVCVCVLCVCVCVHV